MISALYFFNVFWKIVWYYIGCLNFLIKHSMIILNETFLLWFIIQFLWIQPSLTISGILWVEWKSLFFLLLFKILVVGVLDGIFMIIIYRLILLIIMTSALVEILSSRNFLKTWRINILKAFKNFDNLAKLLLIQSICFFIQLP